VHGRDAAPARILVVDDEPSIRLLCRVNLEIEGFEVVEAGTLAEARDVLEAGDVAVVVLDLNLRGERSEELVDECHAHEPPIGVVLMTGSVEVGEGATLGADAVLGKPFELDDLIGTVRDLARVHARR
jgi:DNA-binding NtrC family response regulator